MWDNQGTEYSGAISNTMPPSPARLYSGSGDVALGSTDPMDMLERRPDAYDLCDCGSPKRKKAGTCRPCRTLARRSHQRERFWTLVDKGPGCWRWMGPLATNGYGRIPWNGRPTPAHRIAWELTRGKPFPVGLVADHLCRNHACVNPDHIEPVTNRENLRRGVGVSAVNARRETCAKGHPLDGVKAGGRYCLTCNRARNRAYASRRRTALLADLEATK